MHIIKDPLDDPAADSQQPDLMALPEYTWDVSDADAPATAAAAAAMPIVDSVGKNGGVPVVLLSFKQRQEYPCGVFFAKAARLFAVSRISRTGWGDVDDSWSTVHLLRLTPRADVCSI